MKKNEQGMYITRDPDFLLLMATPDDAALIREYAYRLAAFQHMEDHAFFATEEDARELIAKNQGEVVFGYYKGEVVGFLYFTEKSSIFLGKIGLFIDMLYIDEGMRGKGLGTILLAFLSKLGEERGCERIEWCCMDWNEPAIKFYGKQGAYCVEEMHTYRFTPETMHEVADKF